MKVRFLIAAAIVCGASPALGQSPEDSVVSILRSAQARSWTVRITTRDSVPVIGRITQVSPVRARMVGATVDVSRIVSLERRVTTSPGFLPGVVGGALVGGLLAAAYSDMCEECDRSAFTRNVVSAAAAGGAIVGMIGGTAGSHTVSYTLLWRRRGT